MWIQFSYCERNYYLYIVSDDNSLTVCLTDLITAWKEVITYELVIERFKECNAVEADIEGVKVVEIFKTDLNPESMQVVKTIDSAEKLCHLNLCNESKDLSFRFNLNAVSPEEFKKDITLPLILTIKELSNRQNKLKQLLREKDEEITEYQLEGGKLFRRYLKTKTFDEHQFISECSKDIEDNLTYSLNDIGTVFNPEVNSIYTCAIKASSNYKKENSVSPVKEEPSPSKPTEKKNKNLKWEIGPQNTKRFKTSKAVIKL